MEQKLYFKNSKGNKLCGILSNPTGDKNKPIIILCHGFASSKNNSTYTSLQTSLNENNISTFRFDFFAHGESEGKFEDLTQSEAVEDTLQAIKFIKGLGYTKIGLFGSSFGGLAAIMAASKNQDIYLLALKAPVSSYFEFSDYTNKKLISDWKRKGYAFREGKKLSFSFYENLIHNVAYEVAHKIAIPTLIVHGDADTEVPISQSVKTARLIKNCQLVVVSGAGHWFKEGNTREQMLKALVDFIVKNS